MIAPDSHVIVLLLPAPPNTVMPAPLAVVFVGVSTTANSIFLSVICNVVEFVNCVAPITSKDPSIVVSPLT